MTETFRVRVDRQLLAEAAKVCEQIGTSPGEVTRMMFRQLVARREIPFPVMADVPEAEELSPRPYRAQLADQL